MITVKEIRKNIYSLKAVGYSDLDFHGSVFRNDEGASYNAYLVVDDEITLIDTVEGKISDRFLSAIKNIIGDKPIDNLIVNHTEPDHSSSFEYIASAYPNMKCYCSEKAEKAMQNMYFGNHTYITVKNLETLKIGKYTLTFVLTPFIHWPDNMVTYLNEEKILFSNDAFGNLTTNNMLYDESYGLEQLLSKSKEYYANIVMPCSNFVVKKLDEIMSLNLDIELICPSHGVIWKKYINEILEHYYKWARFENNPKKVVIIFDTIWGNTEIITNQIANKLMDKDLEVRIFQAGKHRSSLIMSEVLDASAILIGTSNFNNTMVPTIADILERIYALKPQNKIGMAYGSYGWAKVHLNRVKERLREAKINVLDEEIYSNYTPDEATKEYAENVANKIHSILDK